MEVPLADCFAVSRDTCEMEARWLMSSKRGKKKRKAPLYSHVLLTVDKFESVAEEAHSQASGLPNGDPFCCCCFVFYGTAFACEARESSLFRKTFRLAHGEESHLLFLPYECTKKNRQQRS